MPVGAVKVRGLRELQRDLKLMSADVSKDLRKELRLVADPVRSLAAEKAAGGISHIGARWPRMRVGVTGRVVYVAPSTRRSVGSPRPNLGGLLMDKAMQPALDELSGEIVQRVEHMLDSLGTSHGF